MNRKPPDQPEQGLKYMNFKEYYKRFHPLTRIVERFFILAMWVLGFLTAFFYFAWDEGMINYSMLHDAALLFIVSAILSLIVHFGFVKPIIKEFRG